MKLPRFGFDWQPIVSEFKRNKFCVAIASRKVIYKLLTILFKKAILWMFEKVLRLTL